MSGLARRAAGLAAAIPLFWLSSIPATSSASAEGDGAVRAVLFSSPTCPHCRKVREEVLPVLGERFPGQLQVAVLSTATPDGRDLYWSAVRRYGVQQRGVPLLVVGDFALVGSDEIPRRLPTLVASYLAAGGVDWPPLPGLDTMLAASNGAPVATVEPAVDGAPSSEATAPSPAPLPEPTLVPGPEPAVATAATDTRASAQGTAPRPSPSATTSPQASADRTVPAEAASEPPAAPRAPAPMIIVTGDGDEPRGVVARVLADPRGNGLAIVVLAGMVAAVVRSLVLLRRPAPAGRTNPLDWVTPLLGLAGLGVAAYLAHVEVREVEAVCGPVGDCNTVQQSEYARLFGVVPIGVLGVLGFAAILVAWGVRRWRGGQAASWAAVAVLAMTGLGTLFSIYLTFLEPFVIGATCLWCLSSAVIMTTLHALAHAPGHAAAAELGLRPPATSPGWASTPSRRCRRGPGRA